MADDDIFGSYSRSRYAKRRMTPPEFFIGYGSGYEQEWYIRSVYGWDAVGYFDFAGSLGSEFGDGYRGVVFGFTV